MSGSPSSVALGIKQAEVRHIYTKSSQFKNQ